MSEFDQNNLKGLEAAITQTLEQQPQVAIPADFASRVRRALPPQPAPRPQRSFGRITALVVAVLSTVMLFAAAPHAWPSFSSFAFDLELLLLAQLAGTAYFLVPNRGQN